MNRSPALPARGTDDCDAWAKTWAAPPLVDVDSNAGTVVLENLNAQQSEAEVNGPDNALALPSLRVNATARCFLIDSNVRGYSGSLRGGGTALTVMESELSVVNSTVRGGDGGFVNTFLQGSGGRALDATGAVVRLSRSVVRGGDVSGAGKGGSGVSLASSTLVVAGGKGNKISGGKSGAGIELFFSSVAQLAPDANVVGGTSRSAPPSGTATQRSRSRRMAITDSTRAASTRGVA